LQQLLVQDAVLQVQVLQVRDVAAKAARYQDRDKQASGSIVTIRCICSLTLIRSQGSSKHHWNSTILSRQ
jgi:hypothetical protein